MVSHPRLIGLQGAAELLGISTTSLRKTLQPNGIHFQVIGGRKIFFYQDILKFKKYRIERAKTDGRIHL